MTVTVLWNTLETWCRRASVGDVPRTVLDELAQVRSVDVAPRSTDGVVMRVRRVVKPESSQAMILERLGSSCRADCACASRRWHGPCSFNKRLNVAVGPCQITSGCPMLRKLG